MSRELRIFVVDDDRDVAEALTDLLELEGHEVVLAHDGVSAVEIFSKEDFDIAFMDVMMPGLNGVESFMQIKRIKPDAVVVMMTGYSVVQLLQQAIAEGVAGVLHKPVDPTDVLAYLESVQHAKEPALRALIASPDEGQSTLITKILEDKNYEVSTASNLELAKVAVETQRIDLVVLDLDLAPLDAIELSKSWSQNHRHMKIVAIADSGDQEVSEIRRNKDNVPEILFKPFDPAALVASLRDL